MNIKILQIQFLKIDKNFKEFITMNLSNKYKNSVNTLI